MSDVTEYSRALAEIRAINKTVSPILEGLSAAERVLNVALKAKADASAWAKEAADIDANVNKLAAEEAEFRRRRDEAEAKVSPAEQDASRRISQAQANANAKIAEANAAVRQAEESAAERRKTLSVEIDKMTQMASDRRQELEVAHTARLAAMEAEIAERQGRLDDLNKAIEDLKKRF